MHPADDKDMPVFVGRFNVGAVSLHLPMILAKSRQESRDFYEVLDYYNPAGAGARRHRDKGIVTAAARHRVKFVFPALKALLSRKVL